MMPLLLSQKIVRELFILDSTVDLSDDFPEDDPILQFLQEIADKLSDLNRRISDGEI